jgi:hypothetical protein
MRGVRQMASAIHAQGLPLDAAQAASQNGAVLFIGQQGQASCQKSWQFEILSGAAKNLLVLRVTEIGQTRRAAIKRAF